MHESMCECMYEQLNGYKYLKSLGIGYHFYTGKYTSAILDILDTDKKTILQLYKIAADITHSFLYVNLMERDKTNMFYLNFTKRLIPRE